MKQRNYYLSFMTMLIMLLLPFGNAKAALDMGTTQLGTITLTRGETITINASQLASDLSYAYKLDYVSGWESSKDAGFYAHNYQNNRTRFSVTGYATCYQQKLSLDMFYTQSSGTYCVKHYYYLVTVNSDSYTKVERDVELVSAGTLSWRINRSDKNTITHLTLHGDLNGDDLKFLREMAGYNDNQGNLRCLDLRDVHFVAGGGDYVTIYDYTPSVSEGYDIPYGAFYWCRKLTEVWLPEKVGTIWTYAFYHCDFLTTVHIPEGAHTVYGANFEVCYNLTNLSIPSTIKTFYPKFDFSYKFRTLYCYAVTPPTRGSSTDFSNITTLYVPQGCKNDYLAKEGWGTIANIYETLAKPKLVLTASPESSKVSKGKSVKLKATASDAEIYYTIDGTNPSKSSTKYTNGVTIDHPLTLKAIAYHDKYNTSDVLTEEYTVKYNTWDSFTATTVEGVEVNYRIADNEGNTCKIYSVDKNTSGKVTIPESVYGMPVVEISRNGGFNNCNQVTSVSLPNSMKRIGGSAFYGCSALSSITGLNNVEYIGRSAFYNTPWFNSLDDGLIYIGKVLYAYKGSMPANTEIYVKEGTLSITAGALSSSNLVSLSIPKSVRELEGSPAGYYCTGLKTIVVASGNNFFDSRGNCNAIIETATNKLITGCSNTVIPNTVKAICGGAFENAPEELNIPNSVDSIAQSAICGTALKKLTIGTGLRKIMSQAIRYTTINSISVASGNPYFDSRDNCNAIIEKSTNTLVIGCPSTIIPNTVKTIGGSAFYTNTDGFNSGRITIPESVEKIETYAFNSCSSLGSVVIGSNVNEIGENAFYGCNGLIAVYALSNNPVEINENVFCSMSSDKDKIYNSATLVVPYGARINYRSTSGWNKFSKVIEGDVNTMVEGMTITKEPLVYRVTSTENKTCELYGTTGTVTGNLSIPSQVEGYTVTSVASYALINQKITSLTLPATVVSMWHNPFYGCNELASITVDAGNPKYDSRSNCNAVVETATNKLIAGCKNTVIPNGIKHIGIHSFFRTNSLTAIEIPSSVEVIDSLAFAYTGLSDLTIPSSVKRIEYRAFRCCDNLTIVTSMIDEPFAIEDNVFEYDDAETNERHFTKAKLRVPYGKKDIYAATDGWKIFIEMEEMEATKPDKIVLPSEASVVVGQTITLTPEITPADAETTLTWKSRNEAIAIVDDNGEVTGVKEGNTFIIVETDNGLSAYCKLTVTKPAPPEPTKIIIPEELSVGVGQKVKVDYTLTPDNAETTITWTIDDETVAVIDEDGILTGKAEGLAVVTATTTNGLTSNLCFITVTAAPEINADVNGDSTVDVADIASIISVMAGQGGNITEKSADVNSDGTVDVADIAAVITRMAELARQQHTIAEEE